ncbi:hypothetical protein [Nocardioides caricicola]|uniref:DUF4175 domain-containing protein n=1 Tax=Nocardioides caricicola TaxID=634770 RepID=A0ABW0N6G4_9ACTN
MDRADPWAFVGMAGMACAFFLYAASLTFAAWWVVALLMLVWAALLLVATAWWTPHPRLVPVVAAVAVLVWVGAVALVA